MAQFGVNAPAPGRLQNRKGAIKVWLNRASRSSLVLLILKGLNSALNAISNFALAYVLVRAIGLNSYAVIASLLAIAALVLQSDLGITGLAFFKLRSHYLAEARQRLASQDDQDLVATIVTVYIAIAVISTGIMGGAVFAGLLPVGAQRLAYVLIFAGAVCALPRMALRVAVNARDGFVWTEVVDLGRRAAMLAATIAMLLGLSFVSYGALNLLAWTLSTIALFWLAQSCGFVRTRGAFRRGMLLLRNELGGIRATVLLSLADFIITVFPYYLLAAARDATAVVAFDMFYKVTRFAVLSYLVGAETVLPHQTRAAHDEDAAGLIRATAKGFMVGLLPMTSGIVAIALFGDKIFGVILNHNGIVSPVARLAICAMLLFLLIQTTSQIVLIGVGRFEELSRRAWITLTGMLLITALMLLFHWSVDAFIVAYVIVYGAGSLLYAECLYSSIRSLQSRKSQERARIETAP